MRRGVWSRDEIRDLLVSAQRASSMATSAQADRDDGRANAYQRGFAAALLVLATAFGLDSADRGGGRIAERVAGPSALETRASELEE